MKYVDNARSKSLFLVLGLLCSGLLASAALAQPVAGDRDAAVALVTQDLGGSLEDVRLWIDPTPLATGQTISAWHDDVFTTTEEGWLVFVDRFPGANWEHPCWYYFVDQATGRLERHDATTPPLKLGSLDEVTNGRDNPEPGMSEAALERYSERLRALPKPVTSRGMAWALIISGGANRDNNHIRYWNDCSFIYRTLVDYYGYTDDHIRVCISDGLDPAIDRSNGTNSPPDLDGDGDDDIEYSATLTHIEQVFTELAASLSASDQLFIYTTDHGGQQSGQDCYLNLWNLQELSDDQLAGYIDTLPCETIVCVFEQCFSGGMVDDIQGEGRVIATAADWDEYSWAMGPDYIYDTFVYHWTSAVGFARPDGTPVDADTNDDGICSMHEAFIYAEANDFEDETPQYSSTPTILGDALNLFGNLDGVYLVVDDLLIDDDDQGASSGDGDGIIDFGETIELRIALHNMGASDAPNVIGTLASTSPYVTLDTAAAAFGPIPGGGTVTAPTPFVFTVATDVPDGSPLELVLATNETPDELGIDLTATAPCYTVTITAIDDTAGGNGDGMAEPGENVVLTIEVANSGGCASPNLDLVLHGTPNCFSDEIPRRLGVVPTGADGSVSGFGVEISQACPEIHIEAMGVDLTAANGYLVAEETYLTIGPWYDTVEQDLGWTLGVGSDTATSGVWERVDPLGTVYEANQVQPDDDHTLDPGHICFVTANGSAGGSAGEADVDGGVTTLLSPIFEVTGAVSANLSYWRWYTNDLGNNPGTDTWRVDVTTDGLTWTSLENTTASNNAWIESSFDLGDYVDLDGTVQFRFVADDAPPGSLVEAAVDDIMVSIIRTSITATPEQQAPSETVLSYCGPNPLDSVATLGFRLATRTTASIELFDLRGRRVRVLHDGPLAQGPHRLTFDAVDDDQRRLAAGIYFVRLLTPEVTVVKQVTVLR